MVPGDPALIWEKSAAVPSQRAAARSAESAPTAIEVAGGRIPLREAHRRFGAAVSTLRTWARDGKIDGVLENGRWMVTPASVAARLGSRRRRGRAPEPSARPRSPQTATASGPTPDGSAMLVPRDAWDKLMDQLGNLHEAGKQLAEARERAARAETEASFLRERLGEMRAERDELRGQLETPGPPPAGPTGGFFGRVRQALRSSR